MEEVMTLEEAAKYLKIAKPTLYRLLDDGKIPAFKVGNQWRFSKELIDRWLWDQIPRKKTVLVVDDEHLICMDLRRIIIAEGHDAVTSQSGLESVKLVADNHFDLVFLDLVLPDIDGLSVLKQIKDINHGLQVVIITGYPDSELMNKALELGPISALKKPFNRKQIVEVLNKQSAPLIAAQND